MALTARWPSRRAASLAPQARRPRLVGVGFDGSPESELALAEAVQLADACGAQLRLVAVVHSGELFPDRAWVGSQTATSSAPRASAASGSSTAAWRWCPSRWPPHEQSSSASRSTR
jgi:Universal stress protein family